jgi:hypothetical protein
VVIDNFDIVGMSVLPFETDSELFVYANTVLTFPFTPKTLQTVPRWGYKIADFSNAVYLVEFALGNHPQRARATTSRCPRVPAVKYVFCTLVVKGFYHELHYNGSHYNYQPVTDFSGLVIRTQKVGGSNPPPTRNKIKWLSHFRLAPFS